MKIVLASKNTKTVYCKRCGNEIDNKSRKCSGCEKQYFKFSKLVFIWCVLAVLVVGLSGLNVYQYLESKKSSLEFSNRLDALIETRDDLVRQRDESYVNLGSVRTELTFWENNAVICTTEGYRYHKYGCSHLIGVESGYIFSKEYAEWKGYTPCLDCIGG